ncbi:hypothetical protein O7634_19500 [Micromonospora sp. WMMD1120]|uniref:hypothetical protein n=1 Tax=Micromonospora sp. WMMD1120 TaxID=3016106 RepID=UPI002417AEB7|nr:hypothetical protein [Micromonospora sp. WMMD1120]MDG4808938.1 hypothetical protein [Micromonospora sp. WMMD1120]
MSGNPTLVDANKDRIRCREVQTVSDDTVLTLTGDSISSSHHQWGFGVGPGCPMTSFDDRGMPGNNGVFSYGRRYFDMDGSIVDYDNYARTGYGTGDIIAGRAGPDACGNAWARVASPLGLATARIAKAKADGHQAYHATTGGVNNTNWTTVLTRLAMCRALEFAGETLNPYGVFRFEWAAVGGKAGIVTNGGGCNFWLDLPVGEDYYINIGVPRYDGPAQYSTITAHATRIVNALLTAGADKVVWMLYYDITPANVDVGQYAWAKLKSLLPPSTHSYLPAAPVSTLQPLIDPLWVGTVRGVIGDLNRAIQLGVPFHESVRVALPPPFTPGDIQITAEGGSPHPSPSGQDALANTLAGALNDI